MNNWTDLFAPPRRVMLTTGRQPIRRRPGPTGANEWSNWRDRPERSRRTGASRQADRRETGADSPINNNLRIQGLDSGGIFEDT